MIKMLGSRNSRYFVVVQSGLCSFYRDSVSLHGDADFEFLWSVALDPQAQVLDIGNHGELFFRTPRGVFRLPYSREAVPHPLAPLCRVAQGEEGARLGKVRLDHRGVEACYERIVPDATLSKKLLRLLRAGEAETQAFAHEVIFYNIASGEERVFFKGLVEPQKNQRFLWEVSPTFTYLVVGQSVKAGMRFQIINIPQEAVYFDFEMKVPEVADLRINDQGTVLLDVPWEDQQRLVLTNIDKEKFVVSPPPGYQVLHLATHHVLLLVNAGPGLMARTFLDQQACLVDLRPLVEMGFQYSFSFPQRQGDFGAGIDVLTWREGSFRVQRTDLNQIAVDAQRWALLARQHREEEQERLARSTAQAAKEEERRRRGQERSQALARDVTPEEPSPPLTPREALDSLSLDDFLTPPPPPAPAALPPPPPREIPGPPAAGRASSTPRPAIPSRIELPVSEKPRGSGPPETPPGPSAPPPGPAAPAVSEPEQEIEKLRMAYISGTLSRDEYFRRRQELEKRAADARAGRRQVPDLDLRPKGGGAPNKTPYRPAPDLFHSPQLEKFSASFVEAMPSAPKIDAREFERNKIERLLQSLEERLAIGEVSPETYRELREKYLRRLAEVEAGGTP